MIYAIVENGIVTNTIVLNESNAQDFPNAMPTNGLFVAIGDTYVNGQFTHIDTEEGEETEVTEAG